MTHNDPPPAMEAADPVDTTTDLLRHFAARDVPCLGSAGLDDRGSVASAGMAFKANGGDDLSVIIDANPQVGRDLTVFTRGCRVSPKSALGSFG